MLMLHEGQWTRSARTLGVVKSSKHFSTEMFPSVCFDTSFERGSVTVIKDSTRVLLEPHFWQVRVDRKVPVKISLIFDAVKERVKYF